jgi:streptogramin lyase
MVRWIRSLVSDANVTATIDAPPARPSTSARATLAAASAALVLLPAARALAAPPAVPGIDNTYTVDSHFDQGELQDVNHDAPNNDQLQLDETTTFFPFVNIAASARGTAVRIDVNSGEIVGEFSTAPDGRFKNPSRTTVDRRGNVWVTNRNEAAGGQGSIARIGVISGGTRVDADGTPNPTGGYLDGPFSYSTCVDRDGDGLIRTSTGLGDILPWTNAGGVDNDGGVDTADDECIINYTRTAGTNARTVAVDENNDVWVGGWGNRVHQKLDGTTGEPVPGTEFNAGCGGYGGFIDANGVLWSADASGFGSLRWDTDTPSSNAVCMPPANGNYGLGLDPVTGDVWHTWFSGNRVSKLTPGGELTAQYPHGSFNAQGVAVDESGNVWVAHSLNGATTVGHLRTDGTFVGNVLLPGGNGPTGVAVDANGKVWVANIHSNNAMRIDPQAGPIGGGGYPVGAVDLTVDLGPGAGPYNYSDMTGSVLGEVTAPFGTWTVRQDGMVQSVDWTSVWWNAEPQGSVPPGTSITFEARASDTEGGLDTATYQPIGNGTPTGLSGRYIEVRATLTSSDDGTSPVLSDVRVQGRLRRVSIGDATVTEGETASLTVSLDAPSSSDVTGSIYTVDGTASAPGDYRHTDATFHIPAGDLSTTVMVPTNEDAIDEPAQRFVVLIAHVQAAEVADGEGLVTIVDDDRNGRFSCRASAVRTPVLGEPIVSNGPYTPCADASRTLLRLGTGFLQTPSIRLEALDTSTDQTPDDLSSQPPADGDRATAGASLERATISVLGVVSIAAEGLVTTAEARCEGGAIETSGTARAASVVVNGVRIDVSRPVTIPLLIGALHLNQVDRQDGEVVSRALFLDLPGSALDVVLAESRAGADGNPCAV